MGYCAVAQSLTLRGSAVDSVSGDRLEDATVTLFRIPGPELVHRVRNRGGFAFTGITKGSYIVVTSYQGFASDSFRFSVNASDSVLAMHIIRMQRTSKKLLEVVVRASIPPVIVKNDTIAFNASAFPSPPNSTVEDLLKKLPGVQVDKEGNVTMNGQKVDKITIDGKDFFLGDPRLASQNLPADIVAQVEAFDSQSEKAKLTGIKEQSTTKTLNIKLKKNRNKGYFGKVYAGGGTDNGYSAGGSVTRLGGEQMMLASVNANNINNQFTGTENFNGPGAGLESLNNEQFNYRDRWAKPLTVTLNAGRNFSNASQLQQLSRQTVLTDSAITQNSISSTTNRNSNFNAYLYLEYALDSLTQLNLRSSYNSQQSANENSDTVAIRTQKAGQDYLSSVGKTDNASTGSGSVISNGLDFRRLFRKKGRLVYINFSQTSSSQDQPASLYSGVRTFDSAGNTLGNTLQNQQSNQTTTNNGYSLSASYTEPVGKRHVLDFNYGINQSGGHSDKESFDYDSLTGKYDHLDSLTTNRFLNHTTVQRFSAGYNTTEGKYRFQLGISGQYTQLSNLNQMNDSALRQNTLTWNPRASLIWQLAKSSNLNFNYSIKTSVPTIEELQPIPDLTNPYLIKTGNPNLTQQLTHNFSANYSSFNAGSFKNWQVAFNGDLTEDQITSSSMVLAGGVQELQYVNVQGVFHLSSNLTYGFPINQQKNGNASLGLHGNYGHDISLVNGQENIAANTGIGGLLNINFHVKDSLFVNASAAIDQGYSVYSLPGSPSSETLNENYSMDINYRLPWSIRVSTYYNLQITGSQNSLPAHAVSLWNAAISKAVFQNHGEIRFSAFDLLNSSSSFSQSTGVNYTQTQKTNLPGRLLLLSLVWRFKHFGES